MAGVFFQLMRENPPHTTETLHMVAGQISKDCMEMPRALAELGFYSGIHGQIS